MTTDDAAVAALRATAHPIRLQMLSLLTGTSMSAAELARELGTTQANASYHLRVLADAGEVVPDGKEVVRGGVAKKYRHLWRQTAGQQGPGGEQVVRSLAAELTRRYGHREPDQQAMICDAEMWVTDEVWAQVIEHVTAAAALMHDAAQAPRAAGTAHRNLQLAAFGMRETER